jgi:hypothetical protein
MKYLLNNYEIEASINEKEMFGDWNHSLVHQGRYRTKHQPH